LKDLEGLEQEACAERMGISRPTFQRVILSARQKLAGALVEGKAIRIEGGNYSFSGITGPGECRHCRPFTEAEIETEVKADVNEGIPGRAGTAGSTAAPTAADLELRAAKPAGVCIHPEMP